LRGEPFFPAAGGWSMLLVRGKIASTPMRHWGVANGDRFVRVVFGNEPPSRLAQRGLLEETLVVCLGEFGRTPRINARAGRDHWGHVYSVALAGGGVRGGQVYGSWVSSSLGGAGHGRRSTAAGGREP
jgi:hypothetical protein